MKHIVHIIARQKFTVGYINFMKLKMDEWKQTFIIWRNGEPMDTVDNDDVIYIGNGSELHKQKELRRLLNSCDKIIVSGVFGVEKHLVFYMPWLLRKTYLHFWGGDFYPLREFKSFLDKYGRAAGFSRMLAIKYCKAWLHLIPGDYDELVQVAGKEKKHFVAPMPGDPLITIDYDGIMNEAKPHKGCRILIGNSATETNRHFETFEMLRHLKDEDIEVICPLSYGDMDYAAKVIEKGKEIFGDKFTALTEFMEKDAYLRYLVTCDVGVFNQNRQQGMGNIIYMLAMGKKVYIDKDTAMWKTYNERGYSINETSQLNGIEIEELIRIDDADSVHNIKTHRRRYKQMFDERASLWKTVLDS